MTKVARWLNVVVTCSGQGHKVRLRSDHFWATARCPTCRSNVDPTRIKRTMAVFVALYRASGNSRIERIARLGTWGFLACVLVVAIGLWRFGHIFWPATFLLYSPRWMFLVPLIFLIPAAFMSDRRLLVPLLVASIVTIGPIMGFRFGWRNWFTNHSDGQSLRVMTYNVAMGYRLDTSLLGMLIDNEPDVLAIQECAGGLADQVEQLDGSGWYSHHERFLCLVSKYPIVAHERMDLRNLETAGADVVVARYTIETPGHLFGIASLHLDSPTAWLGQVVGGEVVDGVETVLSKSMIREIESRHVRNWVDSIQTPFLVVGDFNLPIESTIYRNSWGDLKNAFSHAGFGFGSTRFAGFLRVRIDHILMSPEWKVERARVGNDYGSDHRPMIADLLLSPE